MEDNTEAKASLRILLQSDGWARMCKYIDENIERLDILINDDNIGCEENDKMIYTGRVLNIKQKKMLKALKTLPEKIIGDLTSQIDDLDIFKID